MRERSPHCWSRNCSDTKKGAFTNAVSRRIGRFEEATGGTLFLDEIGELTPVLQSKLLRAVQERTIERLGSNAPIPVDIRLITATSRNLEEAIQEGEFREDYRLNVVTMSLPPLRERRQDTPALVEYLLHRGGRSASITTQALTNLSQYHWPGNIRELEGVVTEKEIELRPAQTNSEGGWAAQAPVEGGWEANFAELEKSLVERALRQVEGNKSKAADLLGIHRRLLYEKMRRHGLS